MKFRSILMGFTISFMPLFSFSQSAPLQGFVHITGGSFHSGDVVTKPIRPLVRVNDFEILDHPVTNKEYKQFIDATGYPPPPHWIKKRIPTGKEEYPVTFVDRMDADAYLKWLARRDGRIYRLPTYAEFEYAARGGLADAKYPWGNEDPLGRANFDADGKRRFDRWQDYLQPAKWSTPNGYGLYGMAGNVWSMCIRDQELATYVYKFRIENIVEQERIACGGSWARSAEYLRCGYSLLLMCVKHPDIGIRPVREPAGADWRRQSRKLCALPQANGSVFLSWGLLDSDDAATSFNVYRLGGKDRYHDGFRINEMPLSQSCSFLDLHPEPIDQRCQYYVRAVDGKGIEGKRSEWCGVNPLESKTAIVSRFTPLSKRGSLVPIFGDLDGDGTFDCVIRMDNGNVEDSQDPGDPVQLEAFASYGKSLWRKDVCRHDHCYGSACNNPFNVYDLDGDGRSEVITRLQEGDSVFVAIMNGMTGQVMRKAPWPPMVLDTQRSSTRILLSVACLDGIHPAIITQTGVYQTEVLAAFDINLKKLWQFNSFAETSGSGAHKIEVADVDGDGKMEVFDGTTCLNSDGTLRWSIYKMHADLVNIYDYIPERKGLEVFYLIESDVHAGVYMVDANSGEIIWTYNRETDPRWTHAHYGWTSDIWAGSPGQECIATRAGHGDAAPVLFSSDGRILLENFSPYYWPIEWDGDATRELLSGDGKSLYNFDGRQLIKVDNVTPNPVLNGSVIMTADLCGDFRDELVLLEDDNGKISILVATATEIISARATAKTENPDYRFWLGRNMGGGYNTIYSSPTLIPHAGAAE
jgi:rhamnogalacturonan endolyase